jgi:hypothetical protein
MTRIGLVLWSGFLIAACLPAQPCPHHDAEKVTLTGVLVWHRGLRDWFGIALDRPMCMEPQKDDRLGEPITGVDHMQLVITSPGDRLERYRPLVGKRVIADGTLMPRHTGYHETPLLLVVQTLRSADGSAVPLAALPRPADPPADLLVYHASATADTQAQRVIERAWRDQPSRPLHPPDAYVQHFFNGAMDTMWVNCREGYVAKDAKSTTASEVFPLNSDDPKNEIFGVRVGESGRSNITIRCERQTNRPAR